MRERQPDIHYPRHRHASIRRAGAPAQNNRQQKNHHHAAGQDRQEFFDVSEPRATQKQNQSQRSENVSRNDSRAPERGGIFVPGQKRQKYREARERRAAGLNHECRNSNSDNPRDNS